MSATEPFFGPEIVERNDGGVLVRDRKAATCLLIGTAPVHEVHDTAEKRASYINKKVIVRRQSDIAKYFGPHRDGYTIPQALEAMFKKAGRKGIGTICVVNVFDPAVHKDVSDNPDPSLVTALDIIGSFDANGNASGLKHAYGCYQAFGWFAKFLCATGFDQLNGVKAELDAIAARTKARYFLDAPYGVTVQQVVEARGPGGDFDFQTNDPRAVLCWPHMQVVNQDETSPNAGEVISEPYSAHLLGVWLSSVMEYGYHHSPSNRRIAGIEDAAQDVLYIPGDASSDVQILRGQGIVTCEERHGKGPHTSGNRNAAYPTSTKLQNNLHVLLIQDMLQEAVLHFLDEEKDRNANPATLERIEDTINSWGLSKAAGNDPVLYDFRFVFDRTQTTAQSVADNHFYYKMEWQPVGLNERLTVEDHINIEMAKNALGLAA